MIARRTLRAEARLEGFGLHSGVPVQVTIRPSDQGIRFRLGTSVIQARPENVSDTRRCTRLGDVSTVEHLMSAFAGLEITDADVELTAPELPGLDGSAAEYVTALLAAGFEALEPLEAPQLFTRVFVQEEDLKIAVSKGTGHWAYRYVTAPRWPGEMAFDQEDIVGAYAESIAPARTFAHAHEVEPLQKAGLGQGLSEKSVLILGDEGYVNPARFPNEPARHKLLDLMGDLYLSGVPVRQLNVSAERSGHTTNVHAAALLRRAVFRA